MLSALGTGPRRFDRDRSTASAGVALPALGSTGGNLHTYSATGEAIPLPPAAAKVVKAHKPQPTPYDAALAALRASASADTRNLLVVLGLA